MFDFNSNSIKIYLKFVQLNITSNAVIRFKKFVSNFEYFSKNSENVIFIFNSIPYILANLKMS